MKMLPDDLAPEILILPCFDFKIFPWHVYCASAKKEALSFCHEKMVPLENWESSWPEEPSWMHCFYSPSGKFGHVLVCMDKERSKSFKFSENEIKSVIVHEATHVVQSVLSYIKEDKPGDEIVAYLMQSVSKFLFDCYDVKK